MIAPWTSTLPWSSSPPSPSSSATETASFYTYLQGLRFFSFGYAAAVSYIQLAIISVVATILVRRIRKGLG